jgi:two-component system, OmpR family, response regulator
MRLLVVEDDPTLARTLHKILAEERFAVDVATRGDDALHQATEIAYDAIILDLMLPGLDGWTVLDTLRRQQIRTPVVILTARDTLTDRVRGLNAGADDYVVKPFAITELVARVRSVIRRASSNPSPVIVVGGVTINTATRLVERDGLPVELTAREYAILEYLATRSGTLVTRAVLQEHIYGDEGEVASNVVDVHIAALRRKLGHDIVHTRRGHGYIVAA